MTELFNADSSNDQQNAGSVPPDLANLVGEGKKYATIELALASVPHKEAHITKLETELAELRKKAAEAGAATEAYNAVQELLKEMKATPPAAGSLPPSDKDLSALLDRKIVEREARNTAVANQKQVEAAIAAKYGEKAKDWYDTRVKELGVDPNDLAAIAAKSPKAALEFLGVKAASASGGTTTSGGFSTERMPPVKPEGIKSVMGGKGKATDMWAQIEAEVRQKYT